MQGRLTDRDRAGFSTAEVKFRGCVEMAKNNYEHSVPRIRGTLKNRFELKLILRDLQKSEGSDR